MVQPDKLKKRSNIKPIKIKFQFSLSCLIAIVINKTVLVWLLKFIKIIAMHFIFTLEANLWNCPNKKS